MLTSSPELLRFLCILVYPTTLIHPLHSPLHTIPEPSELVSSSWSSCPGPYKNNAAQVAILVMTGFLLGQPLTLLPRLLSRRSEPLSLGQSPDLRLMLPPHSWGWQTPRLLLYCVPAGLGGFVLPDPLWPSAKRKQNLDLKVSLWAIPILDQALSVDPTPPGKWEKKKKSSVFCVPHGVASNQDRIISGAQKSLHTPKFLPYLLTDAWNYFHRKQHALFHN